jgi:hypothetical protein
MRTVILFAILMSSFLFAQDLKYRIDTGDNDVNQYLQDVNAYGKVQYDFFKRNLSMKFGISIRDVDRYVYDEKIPPADVYYACALSSVTHKGIDDIIVLYKDKKGWGAVAKELGIKPGSREFHKLKEKSLSGIGKIRSRNKENYRGSHKVK